MIEVLDFIVAITEYIALNTKYVEHCKKMLLLLLLLLLLLSPDAAAGATADCLIVTSLR